MALIVPGVGQIPGIAEEPRIGRPRFDVLRTKFFGLHGESEIRGGRGGRQIIYPVLLFGSQLGSAQQAQAYLQHLDTMVGQNGTLTDNGAAPRTFIDTTFEGFEKTLGPLPDVGGTLGLANGWFVRGALFFYQNIGT